MVVVLFPGEADEFKVLVVWLARVLKVFASARVSAFPVIVAVEAGAFEDEGRCRDFLTQGLSAASWARREPVLVDGLEDFVFLFAWGAGVRVVWQRVPFCCGRAGMAVGFLCAVGAAVSLMWFSLLLISIG